MIKITREMPYDVKIVLVQELVGRHFLPVYENYSGRILTNAEKRIVTGHIAMLFMDPCPLIDLSKHDRKFAEAMLQPQT